MHVPAAKMMSMMATAVERFLGEDSIGLLLLYILYYNYFGFDDREQVISD
jgi:hypothetical protein